MTSGRRASLTRDRLDGMIQGYYEARGLEPSGLLATEQLADLRLEPALIE